MMERSKEQWERIEPSAVAAGSQAQAFYCIQDAQRDIATLTARAERAEAENVKLRDVTSSCYTTISDMSARIDAAEAKRDVAMVDVARLREVLQAAARSPDCGCMPCTGQCRDKYSLEIELEERIDAARTALAASAPHNRRHGIYVASRASLPERGAMWRAFRAQGWPIVSTWIDEDGEGATDDFGDLWVRIAKEVTSVGGLILYAEPNDMPLKGALIEVGMAIGAGVPVYAVLPGVELQPRSMRPVGSWLAHPSVRIVDRVETALTALASAPQPDGGVRG